MGYWTCDDFPGVIFEDENDIRSELSDELFERADGEFLDWLDDNYTVNSLWTAFALDKKDTLDIFDECADEIWERDFDVWEGDNGTVLDHYFIWHEDDDGPSYNRKSQARKNSPRKTAKKAPAKKKTAKPAAKRTAAKKTIRRK